ncbi:MAG: contractile injection system tape measure protein [Pseudomonadota bacterium]
MENRHILEQAVFDISFGSEGEAFEQQADLDAFIRRRLIRVVDEVFDEMSTAEEVLRIGCLEVDLGTLSYHDFQDEMERRLRERLRSALHEKHLSIKAKPAHIEGVVTRQQVELEQIEYFLITGCMPWNADLSEGRTMDQMVQHIVHTSGAKFVNFLKTTARRDSVIKRLVSQFPDQILIDIIRLLAFSHTNFICAAIIQFHDFLRHHCFVEAADGELRDLIWKQLFNDLLCPAGAVLNPKDLVGRILKKILQRLNENDPRVLTLRINEMQWGTSKKFGPELTGIIKGLIKGEEVNRSGEAEGSAREIKTASLAESHGKACLKSSESSGLKAVHSTDIELLRSKIVRSLVHGTAEDIQEIWRIILHDQPVLVKDAIRYYGRQAKVRRNMAHGCSEVMLKDLVCLLEPGECGFIDDIVERPELFRQGRDEQAGEASSLKARLWEFTFTYLLMERGSQFNKKAYIGSLVRQMAAHDNIRHGELLNSLIEVLRRIEAPSGLKKEMLQLLGGLAEQEVRSRLDPGVADSQSQELIHAYDLYERLRECLLKGDVSNQTSEGGIGEFIDRLARDHPWQLLRFYRELQAGELSRAISFNQLSAEVLCRLIEVFLCLTAQAEQGGQSDFISAIKMYVDRARDAKRYYAQILVCLVKHQFIDLETILAKNLNLIVDETIDEYARDSKTSHAVPRKPFTEPQQAPSWLPLSEQAEQGLADYLKDTAKVPAHRAASLIRTIELLITRQPERLRRLLASMLVGRESVARLIELLPERLLTRVLFVLRPTEHHRLQRCADSVAIACFCKEIGAKPEQVHRLKWQFIFEYLFDDGRTFDAMVFARRFAIFLAEQLHWPDQKRFRSLICQQLALNILPSTRELSIEIIAALSTTADGMRLSEAASQQADNADFVYGVEEKAPEITEEIYLCNAGQVLVAPYLPRLFSMLDLTENSAFKDPNRAERAVHLLQFMVNERMDTAEYKLVLNKILCGVSTGLPINRKIAIGDREKELIESLLQGMIQNWKSIGNSSVAGLRESFLQREGRLQLKDDTWNLLIEQKPFDMLLDQIPWSFSPVKHPWMERIVYVDWR